MNYWPEGVGLILEPIIVKHMRTKTKIPTDRMTSQLVFDSLGGATSWNFLLVWMNLQRDARETDTIKSLVKWSRNSGQPPLNRRRYEYLPRIPIDIAETKILYKPPAMVLIDIQIRLSQTLSRVSHNNMSLLSTIPDNFSRMTYVVYLDCAKIACTNENICVRRIELNMGISKIIAVRLGFLSIWVRY